MWNNNKYSNAYHMYNIYEMKWEYWLFLKIENRNILETKEEICVFFSYFNSYLIPINIMSGEKCNEMK